MVAHLLEALLYLVLATIHFSGVVGVSGHRT